jgi:hypothetical protein
MCRHMDDNKKSYIEKHINRFADLQLNDMHTTNLIITNAK